VREWALVALGEIGEPQSLPILLRHLESPTWGLRVAAAIGLGHLGSAEALPALRRAKRRDWWRSKLYRDAINRIG
jgi:HEAT repeat protein